MAGVLAAAVVTYAVVVEPLWGWWHMRRVRAAQVDEPVRIGLYRLTVAAAWTATAVSALAWWASGLPAPDVFVAWPRDTGAVPASLLWPSVPLWLLAVGVGVLFGLAHAYQGVAGVAATGVLGALLGVLVVATGSLLPAMVLHTVVDLRALALPVGVGERPI